MARTSIAALMHRDALAAVEDLDGARRCSQIDLLTNEGKRCSQATALSSGAGM